MIINILSPIKWRYYTAFDYFNQIKRIIELNPEITFNWIVNDSSHDPTFRKMIADLDVPCIYLADEGGVKENYEYINGCDNLSNFVAHALNKIVANMPPCDYALLIEDDIVCKTENPIPLLLAWFEEWIGAVSACVFNKRLTDRFWAVQAMTKTIGGYGHLAYKESGYDRCCCTSFGFIMFKKLVKFEHNYNGCGKSVDLSYWIHLHDLWLDINYCWDIKIWHYFKTNEGLVGVANEVNRKRKPESTNMVRVQLARKGSPYFVMIPDSMTDEDVYNKFWFHIL